MGKQEDKMGFTRFVEMGRVVIINYGPDAGKLGMISDIIDQNRAMVYSPFTTKPRTEADVEANWDATAWGEKIAARKRKATIGDFQRFKDMKAKQVIHMLSDAFTVPAWMLCAAAV